MEISMREKEYRAAEEYILSIPKFTSKNSPKLTRSFYEFLNKPGSKSLIFHVAGTNGKGSVCSYLHSVLTKEGILTGMFTSPHLVTMRERMKVGNEMITKEEFLRYFDKVMAALKIFRSKKGMEQYHPTFFELLFFISMVYFEERNPEVIILETGLGGRLDATNVVKSPKVCVITEIGFDHMEYLGSTLEKIGEEKAGIIHSGCKVVFLKKRQEVTEVIEKRVQQVGALCKSVSKPENPAISFVDKTIDFSFTSRYYGDIPIRLNTVAGYQAENAALALTALEESQIKLTKESMISGIRECFWPARMEEIFPGVFLDGAHNEDGIEAFLKTAALDECKGVRWILFSAVADKEFTKMKEMICSSHLFGQIYVCCLKNARGLKKKELEHIFSGEKVKLIENTKECLEEILRLKKKEDLVYIVGSLYLAGEVKEYMEQSLKV